MAYGKVSPGPAIPTPKNYLLQNKISQLFSLKLRPPSIPRDFRTDKGQPSNSRHLFHEPRCVRPMWSTRNDRQTAILLPFAQTRTTRGRPNAPSLHFLAKCTTWRLKRVTVQIRTASAHGRFHACATAPTSMNFPRLEMTTPHVDKFHYVSKIGNAASSSRHVQIIRRNSRRAHWPPLRRCSEHLLFLTCAALLPVAIQREVCL